MRHLIMLASAGFLLFAPQAKAQSCDPYERTGWTCDSRGFFPQRARKTVKRAMSIGYARGVHPKLKSVYRHVASRCRGVRVVSGVRRTYVRGYRRRIRSLHWSGNALDFRADNYACAYRALKSYGWKWGMSADSLRCGHIHISYGGHRREPRGFRHRRC